MKKRAPVGGTSKAEKTSAQRIDVTEHRPDPTLDNHVRTALVNAAAKVKPLVQREERGELVTAELLNARIGSR